MSKLIYFFLFFYVSFSEGTRFKAIFGEIVSTTDSASQLARRTGSGLSRAATIAELVSPGFGRVLSEVSARSHAIGEILGQAAQTGRDMRRTALRFQGEFEAMADYLDRHWNRVRGTSRSVPSDINLIEFDPPVYPVRSVGEASSSTNRLVRPGAITSTPELPRVRSSFNPEASPVLRPRANTAVSSLPEELVDASELERAYYHQIRRTSSGVL